MKKMFTILLSAISLLSLTACQNQPKGTLFDGEKLAYTEMYDQDGSVSKRWYYKYYPDGEISTSMRCAENGECLQRNEYTYNESKLKETETIYVLGKKASYTEYTYDNDGKLETETLYLPEKVTVTTYYYNPDGTLDYSEECDSEGIALSVKRCIYDSNGNMIKERFFDGNENYINGIEYTYEGKQLISKEYVPSDPSTGIRKEEYTYDGENVIKTVYYDQYGKRLYTDTAEYEGDKCMHRMRVDSNNSMVYTWDSHYDSFVTLIG